MRTASVISITRPGINLQSRPVQIDPFPTYARLRSEYPVCQLEPDGFWAISRYQDVLATLKDTATFSSSAFKTMYEPDWLHADCRRDHSILSMDPPVHTQYRGIVNKAFVHKVVEALIPRMRAAAVAQVQALRERSSDSVEFISGFADPYIAAISAHITGTDAYRSLAEIRELIELTQVIGATRPSDEFVTALERATLGQRNHFLQAIHNRREHPQNDVLSEAIKAELNGQRMNDEQLVNLLDLLLHAGFMTVTNSLTHAIIQLARDPELMQLLRRQPELIPAFIEELLRFEPPSQRQKGVLVKDAAELVVELKKRGVI